MSKVIRVIVPLRKYPELKRKYPHSVFEVVRKGVQVMDRKTTVALRIIGARCEFTIEGREFLSQNARVISAGAILVPDLWEGDTNVGSIEIRGWKGPEMCDATTALRGLELNQGSYYITIEARGRMVEEMGSKISLEMVPKSPPGIGTPVIPTEALLDTLHEQDGVFTDRSYDEPRPPHLRPVPDPDKEKT